MIDWFLFILHSLAILSVFYLEDALRYVCNFHRVAFFVWAVFGFWATVRFGFPIHEICIAIAMAGMVAYIAFPCDWWNDARRKFSETKLKAKTYMAYGIQAKRPLSV